MTRLDRISANAGRMLAERIHPFMVGPNGYLDEYSVKAMLWAVRVATLLERECEQAVRKEWGDAGTADAADLALMRQRLAESDERVPFAQVKRDLDIDDAA